MMVNDKDKEQTASGFGACYASANGSRKLGVDIVVDWVKRYPGIDAFSVAWLEAGGEFDPATGDLTGFTHAMDSQRFATVLKVSSRVLEAIDRGMIVKVDRRVNRPVQSSGLALPGVKVTQVLPMPNEVYKRSKASRNKVTDKLVIDSNKPVIDSSFYIKNIIDDLTKGTPEGV